jgi:hypothetical protein
MTRFADQLFTDLMQEHRSTLQHTELPEATRRHPVRRRAWLAASAGAAAAAITVGLTAFGGSSPAYAVTKNANGTVTVAVYKDSGYAGANAELRSLGDSQVVVVPVGPGCPSVSSLPKPPVSTIGVRISTGVRINPDGSVTVSATGIPAGDLEVLVLTRSGNTRSGLGRMTAPPAPSCVSLPAGALPPPPGGGSGSSGGSGGGSNAS